MNSPARAKLTKIKSGAYAADPLTGGDINFDEWQFWRGDPAVEVKSTAGGLRVAGTSSVEERAFSGLVSRKLYPADAVLVCEVKVPMSMDQEGVYGTVVHLCNRLVGDDLKTLEIPDNNGEAAFARFEDRVGWFRWYYDQTGGNFFKWRKGAEPLPPMGREAGEFVAVRVAYSATDELLSAALLEGGEWKPVGAAVKLRKFFSSIELKIDAQAEGLALEALFRNCRLFPHPARTPLRLFVGQQDAPARNVPVELLSEKGAALASGATDGEGLAELLLDPELVFPLGGRFRVGDRETEPIRAAGVKGIYPGDFYAIDPS